MKKSSACIPSNNVESKCKIISVKLCLKQFKHTDLLWKRKHLEMADDNSAEGGNGQ